MDRAVATCFPGCVVTAATAMTGGSFGTVWRVELDGNDGRAGRTVVLKVGPDPAARLLRYEAGMIASEAAYLRLVHSSTSRVPAPELLAATDDYLFMTLIDGVGLPDLPPGTDTRQARFDSGAAIARLHSVTGSFFGYTGPRPRAANWPDAYRAMIDAIYDDAVDWQLELPVSRVAVVAAIETNVDVLAQVTEPVLTHFDLWDGNVLAVVRSGQAQLTGLVDGERYLYGDRFIDFASPALFRDILDDPDDPFVAGYQSVRPFAVDDAVRRRTWFSRLYLYLLMLVEMPSRGMDPAGADAGRWQLLAPMVGDLVTRLRDPRDQVASR